MTPSPVLAILSALPEEQASLQALLTQPRCVQRAGRTFWSGALYGQPVVLALSRVGKVAAATTAAALIEHCKVGRIVFTGVAGGVGAGVRVGDVVVGTAFVQHDMDASPLFPRYEVPLTGQTVWQADAALTHALVQACHAGVAQSGVPGPVAVHQGLIVSGDRFVSSAQEVAGLVQSLQKAGHVPLAVEMEGAAVAQVCADYGVPCAVVRTVSDRADDSAAVDFPRFVRDVASVYTHHIIARLLQA